VGAQRVFIDNLRIDAFKPGSSDTQLVFDVPLTITDVPSQGRPAILTVANQNSSAQRTLSLLPAVTLTGAADVIPQGVSPATITAGQPVVFSFQLRSRANLGAAYSLTAIVNVPSNQAAWLANLQILDANQNPLPGNQLTVPAGAQVPFLVRINPVPQGTNGVQFSLTVNATAGDVSGSSGAIIQTVGVPADQPDTTITMNFSSAQIQPPTGGTVNATQIQLSPNASALIRLNTTFTVAGNYTLTATPLAPATNWQAGPLASSTPSPFPISQQELGAGSVTKTLEFTVTRLNGATSGQIEFKAQRQGVTQSRRFTMGLVAS
jgi:hypothetical protein